MEKQRPAVTAQEALVVSGVRRHLIATGAGNLKGPHVMGSGILRPERIEIPLCLADDRGHLDPNSRWMDLDARNRWPLVTEDQRAQVGNLPHELDPPLRASSDEYDSSFRQASTGCRTVDFGIPG